jgi:hypothetical protein
MQQQPLLEQQGLEQPVLVMEQQQGLEQGMQQVKGLLVRALSSTGRDRTLADAQLAEWATHMPHFHCRLLDLCIMMQQQQQPEDMRVRSLALILLKNGIDKYWKARAASRGFSLPLEEREYLKVKLMDAFGAVHGSKQLYSQHALVIAKISRHDYPQLWYAHLLWNFIIFIWKIYI